MGRTEFFQTNFILYGVQSKFLLNLREIYGRIKKKGTDRVRQFREG